MSLTYYGIYVSIIGTFLVNSLGFSDACSLEAANKAIEYAPLVIGSIMTAIGRYRIGGVTLFGLRVN